MAIVGVPVLGFGIWQLVSINREIAQGQGEARTHQKARGIR